MEVGGEKQADTRPEVTKFEGVCSAFSEHFRICFLCRLFRTIALVRFSVLIGRAIIVCETKKYDTKPGRQPFPHYYARLHPACRLCVCVFVFLAQGKAKPTPEEATRILKNVLALSPTEPLKGSQQGDGESKQVRHGDSKSVGGKEGEGGGGVEGGGEDGQGGAKKKEQTDTMSESVESEGSGEKIGAVSERAVSREGPEKNKRAMRKAFKNKEAPPPLIKQLLYKLAAKDVAVDRARCRVEESENMLARERKAFSEWTAQHFGDATPQQVSPR